MFLERVWNVCSTSVYQFIYLLIKIKYNKFKIKTMFRILLIFAFLFPSTLNALVFDGKFIQGHFIVGKTQPETEIWIDKKKVKVSKDGFEIRVDDEGHFVEGTYLLETKKEVLHAESNAITKLSKSTQSSANATMYITISPCVECAKLIIQSGIERVVYEELYRDDKGINLLERARIQVDQHERIN